MGAESQYKHCLKGTQAFTLRSTYFILGFIPVGL